jgi:hypothetical protein
VSPSFLACPLLRDGEPVCSETVLYETGARALTLVTTSSELRLQLYSAYLGDEDLREAAVAEVAQSPAVGVPELRSRRISVPRDFLLYHRERALEDHLERFVALGSETEIALALGETAEAVRRLSAAAA